jgi:acyl-CoA reductase-like NAD-dependent aldehyde dehydrogenase
MEVGGAPEWIRGLASIPLPDEVIEDNEQHTVINRYTPLGVVAAIVPWNFPIRLAVGKIAPAVLTGNVVIVKPSYVPPQDSREGWNNFANPQRTDLSLPTAG